MAGAVRRVEHFNRAVMIFFALVMLALGIATLVNAPLSFDGAFFFFRVLDAHRCFAFHGRPINIPLQVPMLVAAHFTENMRVLRLAYCASYASIPLVGLGTAWLVCRSQRAAIFIWPAISICVVGVLGQFFFQSEAIMAATLLWPALLVVLVGAPSAIVALVAISSILATAAHPFAAPLLAVIVLAAIAVAVRRPPTRKRSIGFALFFGVLLLARVFAPLDPWERHELAIGTLLGTFLRSVLGWPLLAIAFALMGALVCLAFPRRLARRCLLAALALAGISACLWSIRSENLTSCVDFRFWVPSLSILLMSGAIFDDLRWRSSSECQRRSVRITALPLAGAIFLAVLSIQCMQWELLGQRLRVELMISNRGCADWHAIRGLRDTALSFWSTPFYAVELQGRKPRTLLLPDDFSCQFFALNGDAILADQDSFRYVRRHGEGWFDFEDARARSPRPR